MFVKYRRHYSPSTESPLAKSSIQEEKSGTGNGLSGIALCSSRSRNHRNSGTFRTSRRNSQDKETSASPGQRKSGGGSDKRDSLSEDGNIVLDTSSILDEIMAKTFESEDENTPSPSGLSNGTASPRRAGSKEETSRHRSSAIDTTSSPALKSKAKQASQKVAPEMSSLAVPTPEKPGSSEVTMKAVDRKKEIRRSGSINKEDYRRSGGNWSKLKGTINGGKALDMFYHNRRSQYFEDSLEEQPKGPAQEQKETHPISPLAETSVGLGQKTARTSGSTEEEPEVRDVCVVASCCVGMAPCGHVTVLFLLSETVQVNNGWL